MDLTTNTGKRIIIEPIWDCCVNIYIEGMGFIGRIFESDLDYAISRLQANEYNSIYKY